MFAAAKGLSKTPENGAGSPFWIPKIFGCGGNSAGGPPTHLFDISGYRPIKDSQRIDIDVGEWDTFEIPIEKSQARNQIEVVRAGGHINPEWAKYFKFYIKETDSEYYNLAMDRIYDAKDGNIWLSFPSSDRNKVDEETFLILKKAVESDSNIAEENRYKILSIENEAPEFIKTRIVYVAKSTATPSTIFYDLSNLPVVGSRRIRIDGTKYTHTP